MSIVVVAGIADWFANEFAAVRVKKVEEKKRKVLWSPLNCHDGQAIYDDLYISVLYKKLSKTIRQKFRDSGKTIIPSPNDAVILLYLDYPDSRSDQLTKKFFPETIATAIPLPNICNSIQGPKARSEAATNDVVGNIRRILRNVENSLAAIHKEVTSRDNRTPLLLPIKNFDSSSLVELLNNSMADVLSRANPFEAIRWLTRNFESQCPPRAIDQNPKKYFVDDRKFVFKSPGSDRHGLAWAMGQSGHGDNCFVRSRYRLGAQYDPRFHYDCFPLRGRLPHNLINCHGEPVSKSASCKHVNIAPNDHIR